MDIREDKIQDILAMTFPEELGTGGSVESAGDGSPDARYLARELERARERAEELQQRLDAETEARRRAQAKAEEMIDVADELNYAVLDAQAKAYDETEELKSRLYKVRSERDALMREAENRAIESEQMRRGGRQMQDDAWDEHNGTTQEAGSGVTALDRLRDYMWRIHDARQAEIAAARDAATTSATAAPIAANPASSSDYDATEEEDDLIYAQATADDGEIEDWYNAALADPDAADADWVLADDYVEVAPEHVPEAWESDETAYAPIDPDAYPLTRERQSERPKYGESAAQARARAARFNARALQDALSAENARLVQVRDARLQQIREVADENLANLSARREIDRARWDGEADWLANAVADLRRIAARSANVQAALDTAEERIERAEADIERTGENAARSTMGAVDAIDTGAPTDRTDDPASHKGFDYCWQCGTPFEDTDQRFCRNCGAERM